MRGLRPTEEQGCSLPPPGLSDTALRILVVRMLVSGVLTFHVKHGNWNSTAYVEPGEVAVGLPSESMHLAVPNPFDVALLERWVDLRKAKAKAKGKGKRSKRPTRVRY